MAPSHKLTRRQVLKGTAAAGALGMLGGLGWLGKAWGAQDKVKMGFIFVGEIPVASVCGTRCLDHLSALPKPI